VSIGAVVLDPGMSGTLDDAIARADEALYRAKHQGRNRVVAVNLAAGSPALTCVNSGPGARPRIGGNKETNDGIQANTGTG
jgi:hypothetical protein